MAPLARAAQPAATRLRRPLVAVLAVAAALALVPAVTPGAGAAATPPLGSPFYHYAGSTPLRDLRPGTVLKTRTVAYSIQGLALPLKAVQILYRTSNQLGRATVNVTTVLRPAVATGKPAKVLSYQSFYDSLNPADEPSAAIAGAAGLGDGIANVETAIFAPALLAGFTVNIPDTEGQRADFAAGPEYGIVTLDSLRAISHAAATGVGTSAKIGMIGYSGGAIGTEWAAEKAATYAPGIAKRLVGSAIGGVLVDPEHNLHYVSGSQIWAGVIPMALIGISRSFRIDLTPYLSAYGIKVMGQLQKASITTGLTGYPHLTWAKLAKPQYATPESVPVYVRTANKLIMGLTGTPNTPLFIGQGTGGSLEGTRPSPAFGAGDGVMLAGDVRTLAREYCHRGLRVLYAQYSLSHTTSVPLWLPRAYTWLMARFAGKPAPSSCGHIALGNPVHPIKVAG